MNSLARTRIAAGAVILIAMSTSAMSQEARNLDIVADRTQDAKLADFEGLIGDWTIRVETFDAAGATSGSYDGEWNFFYILDGAAIQDEFFLPPRAVPMPEGASRFIGTGLRTFNRESGLWESSWIDTSSRVTERWTGTSSRGRIVSTREADGVTQRSTYRLQDGQFIWEQEQSSDGGQSWTVIQTAVGRRTAN